MLSGTRMFRWGSSSSVFFFFGIGLMVEASWSYCGSFVVNMSEKEVLYEELVC
jgi:hypothetical protein